MRLLRVLLHILVVCHLTIVLINVLAFFILPFTALIVDLPFRYTVFLITPVESMILFISFARSPCPLTILENRLRRELKMKEIGGFISYYIVKQKWRDHDYKGRHNHDTGYECRHGPDRGEREESLNWWRVESETNG